MPTISQLPSADPVSATDLLLISQSGSAHSVSVGTLLAQTQPAIVIDPPSLLGRFSVGPGGPDAIMIGQNLSLSNGTLNAAGFDLTGLPTQPSMSSGDQILIVNESSPQLLNITQFRDLFAAGSNVAIDVNGTISASILAPSAPYSLSSLPLITTLGQADLVGVSQDEQDHTITYSDFLNGLTIDDAQVAAPASDSDTFWVAQASNTMLRQTMSSLWPWILDKLTSSNQTVIELTGDTELSGAEHNNTVLVCGTPISISANSGNLGSGFSCQIVNLSAGQVLLSSGIVTQNQSGGIIPNQSCTVRCITYSGGTVIFASFGSGGTVAALPGQVTGLTASSLAATSVGLSWAPAESGGIVSNYAIEYRETGTTSWTALGQTDGTVTYTAQSLQSSTSYDFVVAATNSLGSGPTSAILTVDTLSGNVVPVPPTALAITNVTATGVTCSWTASTSGGTEVTYAVQYAISGQSDWSTAISNLSATTTNIVNLAASTSYLIEVIASSSAGSSPPSTQATFTTAGTAGQVTNIAWNVAPVGSFTHGSGAIGVNVHVTPATAAVQFGFSASPTVPPSTWTAGAYVNTNLWGAYVATPGTVGTWYAWAEGTDASATTAYATPFTTT